MRYKCLLGFLLVFFSINIYAQKDEFSQAVDYCNCKLTSAYLNQFTSQKPPTDLDKKNFDKIKTEFGDCTIGKSIEYSSLSALLEKNSFSNSNTKFSKVINELKKSYKDGMKTDEAAKILIDGIYENPKLSNAITTNNSISDLKKELSSTVSTFFKDKFAASESANENTTPVTEIPDVKGKAEGEDLTQTVNQIVDSKLDNYSPSPWSINWLSIILAIVVSIILFVVMRFKKSEFENEIIELRKSRENQRNDLNNIKRTLESSGVNNNSRSTNNFRNDWQNNMEEKISEANKQISKLDVALLMLKEELSRGSLSKPVYSNQQVSNEQQPKAEILYASIPTKDGSFNENAISNTINPTASFYKFIITDSADLKAKFEFLGNEERAVKDATNAPDRILRPACKINNALNQNAKRIKTTTQGTVIKQNGKWVVDTLAEIEYE
jgi:uncharacterized membrane-anchored protein YhcB (DUF1043 family)